MSSEGMWLASDGRWYPQEPPPSANVALVLTLLGAFWIWILIPFAVYFSRKAKQEAASSGGRYAWSSRSLLHRPLLLWLLVFAASMALILGMVAVGAYGDPGLIRLSN